MSLNKRTFISLAVLSALASTQANAADPVAPPLPDNFPRTNSLDENLRDNLDKIHAIETQRREDAAWKLQQQQSNDVSGSQNPTTQPEKNNDTPQNCVDYSSINLNGITYLDASKWQVKLPQCVNDTTINQFNRELVGAYLKAGYPHTQIDFENADNRVLNINVKEGRIREITGGSRRVNVNTLFPNHKNRPLNIKYLDQGIEQANKLVGNNVSMDIYPHSDGTASVELKNETSNPVSGSLTFDNKGGKPNRGTARVNLAIDSPLGLSDSLYLGASTNTRTSNNHYSRSANAFYSVPYGAWTLSAYASTSRSQSITEFAQSAVSYAYRSKSGVAGVKAERMLSRGQGYTLAAYAGADYLSQKATFGGSELKIQSPKIKSGQMGLSHTKVLSSGILMNDVNVERGVAKDINNTPFDKKYTNLSVNTNLIQNRRLGNWVMGNRHSLSAQFGKNALYSAKEFDIIGRNSVRGFNNLSLNANRGAYLTNTLTFRRNVSPKMYVEPFVGADVGAVKDDAGWQKAAGISVGINVAQYGRWNVSFDVARGFARTTGSKNSIRQEQVTALARFSF